MPSVQQGVGFPQDREDPAQRLWRSRLSSGCNTRLLSIMEESTARAASVNGDKSAAAGRNEA